MPAYCAYWRCENDIPEKYYVVIRIIKTGNKRRRTKFCSVKCLIDFFIIPSDN